MAGDVRERTEAVELQLVQPIGVVERLRNAEQTHRPQGRRIHFDGLIHCLPTQNVLRSISARVNANCPTDVGSTTIISSPRKSFKRTSPLGAGCNSQRQSPSDQMVSLCSIRRPPTKVQIQSERVCGPRRSARVVRRRSAGPTRRSNVCCSVIGHSRAAGSAPPRLQDGAAAKWLPGSHRTRSTDIQPEAETESLRGRRNSQDRLRQSKPNAPIPTHRLASKATRVWPDASGYVGSGTGYRRRQR